MVVPRILIPLFLLLTGYASIAQTTREVRLAVNPSTAWVRLDGETFRLTERPAVQLPPGTHRIEFWATEFDLLVDTVRVLPGNGPVIYRRKLAISAAYNDYREELATYRSQRGRYVTPAAFGAGFTVGALYFLISADRGTAEDLLSNLRMRTNSLETSLVEEERVTLRADFADLKRQYENEVDAYNRRVTLSGIAAGVFTGGAIYYLLQLRKLSAPEFTSDNPFVSVLRRTEPHLVVHSEGGSFGLLFTF